MKEQTLRERNFIVKNKVHSEMHLVLLAFICFSAKVYFRALKVFAKLFSKSGAFSLTFFSKKVSQSSSNAPV